MKSVGGRKVNSSRHGRGERWRARYVDPLGRECSTTFARKADAELFLASVETDTVRGAYLHPSAGRVTLDVFYADWSQRQLWESNTRKAMGPVRSTQLGDVPLGRLRRSHVEVWIKRMHAAGLAPGTIRTRVNNVRSVLRGAVYDHVIAVDPSDGVTLPRDRRREAAMTLPTTEQVGALMAAAAPACATFIALCAFAGLRLGEAAALQVGDIDFLRRTLVVRRQVQRADAGAVEIRGPKYGSERTVFLADGLLELLELLELLAAHLAQHRPGPLDLPDRGRRVAAPEYGGSPLAQRLPARRPRRDDAARPAALLRLGSDRRRLRRRHRPTSPRTCQGHDDPEHLRTPVADR